MTDPLQAEDPTRIGDYELTARLGEGGQGVVYLGTGPSGNRVAVKLLKARHSLDATSRARFAREIAAAGRVAGFCTAQILDSDLDGPRPYLVSEYVSGPSLQALVRESGPLDGTELDRLAISTATALTAIHQAGVVHRDFKPPNVLMGSHGPRVIDFGIARLAEATTMTSQAIGTPAYMAPEQLKNAPVTAAADMFAWSATVLFAATGRSPFDADSVHAVIYRVLHHEPDTGALTGPLAHVVRACLDKDPARRPGAVEALMSLLRAGGTDLPASAPPTTLLSAGAAFATGLRSPDPPAAPAPPRPAPAASAPPEPRGRPAEVRHVVSAIENARFSTTRLRPGYDEQEVDAFLDEVAQFLTGRSSARMGGQDVRNRLFKTVRLRAGYDEQEVDAFLDWLEAELLRLGHP